MGYQALTGHLPDAVQLYFLESGLVGRAEVDDRRIARAEAQIAGAAHGIRTGLAEGRAQTVELRAHNARA